MRLTRFNKLTNKYEYHLLNPNTSMIEDEIAGTQKLGQLEDIEEALTHGFYYKDYTENDEIRFSGNVFIQVNDYLVETKPCYAVKETTLYSCYNPLGYPSETKEVKDAHYWSWKTCLHFKIKDYGKTWALTREELENETK